MDSPWRNLAMTRVLTLLARKMRNQPTRTGKIVRMWDFLRPMVLISAVMVRFPTMRAMPTMEAENYNNYCVLKLDSIEKAWVL